MENKNIEPRSEKEEHGNSYKLYVNDQFRGKRIPVRDYWLKDEIFRIETMADEIVYVPISGVCLKAVSGRYGDAFTVLESVRSCEENIIRADRATIYYCKDGSDKNLPHSIRRVSNLEHVASPSDNKKVKLKLSEEDKTFLRSINVSPD